MLNVLFDIQQIWNDYMYWIIAGIAAIALIILLIIILCVKKSKKKKAAKASGIQVSQTTTTGQPAKEANPTPATKPAAKTTTTTKTTVAKPASKPVAKKEEPKAATKPVAKTTTKASTTTKSAAKSAAPKDHIIEVDDNDYKDGSHDIKEIKNVYHISQNKDEKSEHFKSWRVRKQGSAKTIKYLKTQEEAITYAKELAANNDGYIVIHKMHGGIRKQNYNK